jgi:hypothetical protein
MIESEILLSVVSYLFARTVVVIVTEFVAILQSKADITDLQSD